jgi:Ca2+-binding EF-hand superfamily protein
MRSSRNLARLLAATGIVALAWSAAAVAQQSTSGNALIDERFAFEAADTDADGVVSLPELGRDAAHGFATLDTDGDGKLKAGDLAEHDPALFSKVDANGDGVLTFTEVMANKVRAFGAGDKNQDGGLSFEEMVEIVEIETGAAS